MVTNSLLVWVKDRVTGTWLWSVTGAALVLAVSALLLGYNLTGWPVTWYDEGITLQVARNLAESAKYGIASSDGFRAYSPIISTGPTVSAPIALVFSIFGSGLIQARSLMITYALLSVLCMYLLARRLFDDRTAVFGSLLLVSVGAASGDISASFLGLGRMVMGEIPAFALLLLGTLVWSASFASGRHATLVGVGLLWGLSVVTKPQFVFIFAGLLLTWIVHVLTRRQPNPRQFVIPLVVSLVCAAAWSLWQHCGAGASQVEAAGRIGTQLTILTPRLIVKSIRVLLLQREIVWGLPGLLYGLYLTIVSRCSEQNTPAMFLILTCLIWLSWFVLGSVGWGRYAFVPIAISMLFAGKLLVDVAGQLRWPFESSLAGGAGGPARCAAVRSAAVLFALVLMVGGSLQSVGREIVMTRDDTPSAFAQYLDDSLPRGTVIECFEPEIVFLSRGDFQFHQPTLPVLNLAIRHAQLGVPYTDDSYDFRDQAAQYVINGPFSKLTGLYDRGLEAGSVVGVKTVGAYDLYRIRSVDGQ